MTSKLEYKLLETQTSEEMEKEVNLLVCEGWEPWGPLVVAVDPNHNGWRSYHQWMIGCDDLSVFERATQLVKHEIDQACTCNGFCVPKAPEAPCPTHGRIETGNASGRMTLVLSSVPVLRLPPVPMYQGGQWIREFLGSGCCFERQGDNPNCSEHPYLGGKK